jgi:hypothetical protein
LGDRSDKHPGLPNLKGADNPTNDDQYTTHHLRFDDKNNTMPLHQRQPIAIPEKTAIKTSEAKG